MSDQCFAEFDSVSVSMACDKLIAWSHAKRDNDLAPILDRLERTERSWLRRLFRVKPRTRAEIAADERKNIWSDYNMKWTAHSWRTHDVQQLRDLARAADKVWVTASMASKLCLPAASAGR